MKSYQDKLITLSNNCCLAICYLWAFEPDISYAKIIKILGVAIEKGYISEDGFVRDADKLIFLATGKKVRVLYSSINNGKTCCANFKYGEKNHWVVVDGSNNILYNPLEYSNCVENGEIVEYRIW